MYVLVPTTFYDLERLQVTAFTGLLFIGNHDSWRREHQETEKSREACSQDA